MISLLSRFVLWLCLAAYAGSVATQETASDAPARASESSQADAPDEAEGGDTAPDVVDSCFNFSRTKDINVLNDQYVYIRTYAGNQYLVRLDGVCDGLHREYIRGRVAIQPIGRDVCTGDGSHFVHYWSGRMSMCPIGIVETVEDRVEARAIAAGGRAGVEAEVIRLPD